MNFFILKLLFSSIFSFLITFYLIPFFSSLAIRLHFVDIPDGKIKKHEKSTPYLGGIAIYCGFLFGLSLTIPFENQMFLFLVGGTLLLFLGLIDDLFVLRPYQKFFGQFIVSLCFLKAGFFLKDHFFYNIWSIPLSLFWILSIINAFNLVDIMDGLATLIAIMATVNLLVIAFLLHNYSVIIILSAFLGSLCAFFWYNRPRAQIYLGDAGSLFIGGFLATIPFLFNWSTYTIYGFFTPIIILAIPLLECSSLIIVRLYKGIPFYKGSPDHFACYLQANGWSIKTILFYIFSLSILLGIISICFFLGLISFPLLVFLGFMGVTLWIIVLNSSKL